MGPLRTLLFVPATRERLLAAAGRSGADAAVIDLEDAVAPAEKTAARAAARRWAPRLAEAGLDVFVRINPVGGGRERADLLAVVGPALSGIVIPKVETPQHLRDLDVLLREAEVRRKVRPGDMRTIPIIESPRGVLRCEDIARATDRVLALSLGGEDYTRELGVPRTADGVALQHARGVIVTVAAAHRLVAIDTPYADFRDERGLREESRLSRAMGFHGKYVIHPSQVAVVRAAFMPGKHEVAAAREVVQAYERSLAQGAGATSVNGRMVDAPVAERARAIIAAAQASGASRKRR